MKVHNPAKGKEPGTLPWLVVALLKQPIYMFGGACRAIKFNSLPLIKQCQRCWHLGYDIERCSQPKSFIACSICGSTHKVENHQFKCSGINKHTSLKCSCIHKCINCVREKPRQAVGHLVCDLSCPLRKKIHSIDSHSGDTTDEEARVGARAASPIDVDTPLPNA